MNMPKVVVSGAWGRSSGSNTYRTSSDASLFSSSLPVLPHEKLKLTDAEAQHGYQFIDDTDIITAGLNKLNLDVEARAIGSFLPDDESELLAGILDDFDLSGLPNSLDDLDDYDVFNSGGGMELEIDPHDSFGVGMSRVGLPDTGNGLTHFGLPNGAAAVVGEHPYGEHPSRTLFVRNINSNVEDAELRALFEQYGDIRTLYTACKHRGFVMISYYDIRDARTAMRALQNKPLRRRKLDIHFSIPKDNPSDKDVNQGTLVVFNLDPSVSNEDLHQIFGAYGMVKEIRETPHKRHHKFIEFYDVRAAEAALKSLNRSDIAGKRIKLEPSRPGGARRNLMLHLNQELDQEETRGFRHQIGSPVLHSPPGNWMQFNSPIEQSPLQSISKSPVFSNISPTTNHHLPGLASILHPQISNSLKVGPIGSHNGHSSLGTAFQHPHSYPEPKLSQHPGSISSFTPSTSNGSGIETLSGPQFLWGSPNLYSDKNNSSSWSKSSIGQHAYPLNGKAHGIPLTSQHGSLLEQHQHNHHHYHVGSAPSGLPIQRHFGFFPESSESSYMNRNSLGGMGLGHNDSNFMMNLAVRGVGSMPRNMSENGGSSSLRMMPSQRLSPAFLGNGLYPGLTSNGMEGFIDHARSRQMENNGSVDNKKQFQLDLEKIIRGDDPRTTLMIKNIPNKYTSKMLLSAIDENFRGTYDFLYLPIDFKNKCNVGYAFINMLSPAHIIRFYEAFNDKKWEKFNSEKVASLAYARIQGKSALVAHFQNSSLMNEDKRCRPIVFHSEGSEVVDQSFQENVHPYGLNLQVREPNEFAFGDSPSGSPPNDASGEKLETS
ncbi:hypothetical protein ACFE04_029233 [Oxalis oulophora]